MQSILRKTTVPFGIIIAAVIGCVILLFAFILAAQAQASSPRLSAGERLVSVHDHGKERGILTHATTLRDAFKEAGIEIDPNDRVEPGLDEELVATNYEVNIYRARPVTIVDGAVKKRVMSPYQTPEQIAKNAGMELHDEDVAEMSLSSDMMAQGTGVQLAIDRATSFTLVLYGKKMTAYTQEATVGAMLEKKEIELGKNDTLSVPKDAEIREGMKVEIWRNGKQTVTEEQEIAFEVEEIQDPDREVGYREVKTPGTKGKKSVTYEVVMKNGKEVSRKEIQSVVMKKPKKEVVIVGAKIEGPEEIMAKIRAAARAKGIDVQRVLLIAQCESHFNPQAGSYYKGIFQHDPSYWSGRAAKYGFAGASIFDVDAQIGVSTSMMAEGGWSHWGCDPGPQ